MVSTVVFLGQRSLAVNGSAEFAGPEDERVVEQAAAAQVFDKRGLRLVDCLTLRADFTG